MDEAKKVHTSLRKAAGLIKFVQDTLLPQLVEKVSLGSDLDIRVRKYFILHFSTRLVLKENDVSGPRLLVLVTV